MCHRPPRRVAGGAREHRGGLPPGGGDGGRHGRARRPPVGRRPARRPPRRAPGRRPGGRLDASRRAAGRRARPRRRARRLRRAWPSTSRSRTTRTSPASSPTDALADDVAAVVVGPRRRRPRGRVSSFDRASIDRLQRGRVAADRHRVARDGRRPPDAVEVVVAGGHRRSTRGGRPSTRRLVERAPRRRRRRQRLDLRRPGGDGARWPGGASTGSAPTSPTWRSRCCAAERAASGVSPPAVVAQREQQVHHLGPVLEAQPAGLAQVVAVDLVRERAASDSISSRARSVCSSTVRLVSMPPPRSARASVRRGWRRACSAAERDGHQPAVEGGRRGEVERAVAEVGVRVGVEHDR